MDELKLEPLEPFEVPEPMANQGGASGKQPWNFRRLILPAALVLGILLIIGIYLLVSPASEKIMAQVFQFDILPAPDTGKAVLSITNRQDKQVIITKLYPVLFGKEHAAMYSRSIEGSTIKGVTLPLVINPGEVRVIKIVFSIRKEELIEYADNIKDSNHIAAYAGGPLRGQRQGTIGLGLHVVDADGENYTNTLRTVYYNLAPTPPGFPDPIALDHRWMVSEEPFEFCTNEDIVK